MGIGVSLVLMAAGAVLAFAVDVQNSNGFDLNAIGVILMIIGAIGLIATLVIWGPRSRRTVVDDGVTGRRLYRRDEF
jgi:hypothetical protein